ncbi:MAG: T9SS type A sorting domain-containing protein [Chitinophagaceae bacterium]
MKKIYDTLLFLILYSASFAQTVFAPDGAAWHFEHIADFEASGQNYSRFAKEKDTIYLGHLCAKIPGTQIAINSSSSGYDTTELETQYTYTSGDTIFYYNHVFNRFLVLYRFDVKVGDTVTYHNPFKIPAPYDSVFSIIIDSVKWITIDGLPVRNIRSHAVYPGAFQLNYLTERMGPLNAFSIQGYTYKFVTPEGGGLRCYSDAIIDTNTGFRGYTCSGLAPLTIDRAEKEISISVFPNPVQDELTVTIKPSHTYTAIHIGDIFGNSKNVPFHKNGPDILLHVHDLPGGIYFLQLTTNDEASFRTKFQKE